MAERLGNLGYLAIKKQVDKDTPIIPTAYAPFYEETLSTNANFQPQQPAAGIKFATTGTLQGQRDHQGDITVLAEPNTTAMFLDNLYTIESTSGANPYTRVFGLSASADPQFYTYDISLGNVVKRFWGVGVSDISSDWQDNELRHKLKVSALGSFQGREIASVSTNTITLSTKYDPVPNKGLVATDLVTIFKESTGATLNTTVTTVNADGITVVLGASAASFAAGDMIHLRPATISFALLDSFLWAKTYFGIGATAAAALTNATNALQTRVEQGSTYELMHPFETDEGSKRSGGFDPAALPRMTGDASLSIKRFFDTAADIKKYNALDKQAVVIRHLAGLTNQYEYRVTFHNVNVDTPVANVTAGEINYATYTYKVNNDPTDGRAITVTVINALASL